MVIYSGPSRIDGSWIIALLTGVDRKSENRKTAGLAQLYILVAGVSPMAAIHTGRDAAVCGKCMHRGIPGTRRRGPKKRTCYVIVCQGATAAWKKWKRGGHPYMHPMEANAQLQAQGLGVRLGAYGEPGALPLVVLQQLTYNVEHTGYTHMWPELEPGYQQLLMASVDVPEDLPRAHSSGWRTFRVRTEEEPTAATEISCPASAEAGHRTTCNQCVLCGGTSTPAKNITIQIHGNQGNLVKFIEVRRAA